MYADGETLCEVAAIMPSSRDKLRAAIDRLTDAEVHRILALIESNEEGRHALRTLERLSTDPAFNVPLLGLRAFRVIEPVAGKGMPASEMLAKDRR